MQLSPRLQAVASPVELLRQVRNGRLLGLIIALVELELNLFADLLEVELRVRFRDLLGDVADVLRKGMLVPPSRS